MLGHDRATAVALVELDRTAGLLQGVDDSGWSRPTACEGWDVTALARHVAAVAWQQSEAFHRARLRITETPSFLELGSAREEVIDAVAAARGHLASAFDALGADEQRVVPLPFAPLPAAIAWNVLVFEYGLHRHDIERALGQADDTDLDREVATAIFGLVGGMLPLIAAKPADAAVAYRLVGESGSAAIEWHDERWQPGDAHADDVCEIVGSDAAIALFATGRIAASHPALACTDPAALAGSFKQYFPGP